MTVPTYVKIKVLLFSYHSEDLVSGRNPLIFLLRIKLKVFPNVLKDMWIDMTDLSVIIVMFSVCVK